MRTKLVFAISLLTLSGLAVGAGPRPAQTQNEIREQARKLQNDGNHKEAFDLWSKLALNPKDDPQLVSSDFEQASQCLRNLQRIDELDEFREKVIAAHSENWRLLKTAASNYIYGDSYGYIVAGKFYRGQHRGGDGRYVNSFERDRIRALQLLQSALSKIPAPTAAEKHELFYFYSEFSRVLLWSQHGNQSWRLQALSDLSTLPDYEDGYYGRGYYWGQGGTRGAPANPDGSPVFHKIPESYESAKSDGERWRWMLVKAMEAGPENENLIRFQFASFLKEQFDVHTLADYGYFFADAGDGDEKDAKTSAYAVHFLEEDETIARLASGIRRFKLPEEFNFIHIFQNIANQTKASYKENSLHELAEIFSNRRQYDKAAIYWKRSIAEHGDGNGWKQAQFDQILKNWGEFEPILNQPAGSGATVDYRFRNGNKVHFEAYEILVPKLLEDLKSYLKSNPNQLDWNTIQIENIGYRIVNQNETRYLGKQIAAWDLELKPLAKHFDRRITVSTPLQNAGAYFLTAQMENGNTSRIVVWLNDTVIVKKPLDQKHLYFIADARNGAPIAKANVEFLGYKQENNGKIGKALGRDFNTIVRNFAELSDESGQIALGASQLDHNFQWLAIARTDSGRLAHLGFSNVWYGNWYEHEYNQTKSYFITDRPVYRPNQNVQFKCWVRHTKYDQEDSSSYANSQLNIQINDPKGEKFLEKRFTADAFGGISGEFSLPKDATLGVYTLHVLNIGGGNGTFRVEEYKKPEFEVSIESPAEPVALGEKISAKILAKYYFGAPVTKAKVHYKVTRSEHSASWFPWTPWDWCFGPGYWWFCYDYNWYPGWVRWGCERPIPWWWHDWQRTPPELVMEGELPIGEDGTLSLEIDTALAKAIHGDKNHRYDVTAEVTDESRRTIVGNGRVIAARDPFKVYVWVNRGHYRVGDSIHAEVSAQTLENKPVAGKGELSLFKISYDEKGEPTESLAQKWEIETDSQGRAKQQIQASEPGQFRLSCKVTDSKGHSMEGGYIFVIAGKGFDSAEFRFNEIELTPDKRDYQPGEKVQLRINTNQVNSTVLLFIRPANGIYLPPKLLRLKGKSAVEEIEISKRDMPNFFVEALTIHDGKVYSEVREIVVPPEKRVLNVEVLPSSAQYKPGEMAKVQLKLTDFEGKAFVGSMALAVYDKALEYISGGSNVPEIRDFFWKWRRSHYQNTEHNLGHYFSNLLKEKEISLQPIGVFGRLEPREEDEKFKDKKYGSLGKGSRRLASRGGLAMNSMEAEAPMSSVADSLGFVSGKQESSHGDLDTEETSNVQPTVRSNFADTAFWAPTVTTDQNGFATLEWKMPENLTGWKIRCWGMGHGTKVGEATSEVVTTKNLLLRMQAPRFFVEKDEVVLSANIHNYLSSEKIVEAILELDGKTLEALGPIKQKIKISSIGEQRVDWRVKVLREGEAVIRMKALTDEESDAMQMRFPVKVHGIQKTESFSLAMRPETENANLVFTVPAERRLNASRFELRYSPTLAGAMVDALPYLVDYPYGCTEQTLSRFLPTVIVQKILLDMKLDLAAIQEKRTNLNAQEIGDDKERAKQWLRFPRNPVFDAAEVRAMAKQGLEALTAQQLSDGGWGWFSGYGEHSYPHTTAYVVHGLQIAQQNGLALVPGVLDRGVTWLKNYQAERIAYIKADPKHRQANEIDAFIYMVLVDAEFADLEMMEFLYRDRNDLAVYAKAMFGMALAKQKQEEKLAMILQNITQYLVQDEENQTAYLRLDNEAYWWYWYGSEYEAQAYYLKLLTRANPNSEVASRLVKYLLNNRKNATFWNSTRDTAICIEAFADYLRASKEIEPNLTVEILLDGRKLKEVQINRENLFSFDNKLVLEGEAVETGKHTIEIRKKGQGPLYANAYLGYFSLEDFITKAGLEIKVQRKVYRLKPVDKSVNVAGSHGQAVSQKVEKYQREELANHATLKSGELVEIELEIDSKNDYEYLIFEDLKAAGFEPVEVRSGYNGNDLHAYVEFRDDRVAFFTRTLARGKHSVSYRLRAEIPGKFSALPTLGYAMYAPELKANSDEIKLEIQD